jgi:SAM-dependent methyltransferase
MTGQSLRILFTVAAPLRQSPAGPTSDLASTRYRVVIPAQQLTRLGHQVQAVSLPADGDISAVRDAQCDVLVVSKSLSAASGHLAAAMKSRGVRIVADFCDDHFEHADLGPQYRDLARVADVLVASTDSMAQALRRHTGRESIVITDPVEGPRGVPSFRPGLPALRMTWFGHPTNLDGLVARLDQLQALARRMPVRLEIVTSPLPEVASLASDVARSAGIEVAIVPWSIEATWKSLKEADAVWIPVAEAHRKEVKSPNRLLEAVWAGRLVVADAIPAYEAFADILPVGQGLAEPMAKALADPQAVEEALRAAQRRIAREHSGYQCGRRWARALGDSRDPPVRLNLGCGDKILPGYVNVDVVESRAGMRPDVICDLHDLVPFADDSADEILSVHVIEHFWRWEVLDVLREWVRVLKPGGRMVVECPNLASACRTFLEDPAKYARAGADGQRTMWVFYGDPQWKDPLMIHRWGYTPESLAALLGEAGLRDVRQEPAQYKLREPRDMRIVGIR